MCELGHFLIVQFFCLMKDLRNKRKRVKDRLEIEYGKRKKERRRNEKRSNEMTRSKKGNE